MPRRRLPPLNALRAFESAARRQLYAKARHSRMTAKGIHFGG